MLNYRNLSGLYVNNFNFNDLNFVKDCEYNCEV